MDSLRIDLQQQLTSAARVVVEVRRRTCAPLPHWAPAATGKREFVYNYNYAPPDRSERVFRVFGDGKRDWSAIPPFFVQGPRGSVRVAPRTRSPAPRKERRAPELTGPAATGGQRLR